jgi:hypothetical protein
MKTCAVLNSPEAFTLEKPDAPDDHKKSPARVHSAGLMRFSSAVSGLALHAHLAQLIRTNVRYEEIGASQGHENQEGDATHERHHV